MLVRALTPDDAAVYVALRREMLDDAPWAFAASPETDFALDPSFMTRLGGHGQAIVGGFDATGRLVGAAGLIRNRHPKMAHRAIVWGVFVTPSARRRGLASAIMSAVLDVARSWPGVTSVGLSVSARADAAHRLYQRLGFVQWGVEPAALVVDGRGYDEIHMVAFLDPRR